MARQKLIHLHGTSVLQSVGTGDKKLVKGEIAVRNANAGEAQLYVTNGEENAVVTFIDSVAVNTLIGNSATLTKDAYEAADKALSDRIAAFEGDGDGSVAKQIETAVAAEAELREAGDANLQGQIDAKVAQTDYDAKIAELEKADSDEAVARADGDTALSERIAAFEEGDNSVAKQIENAVAAEAKLREEADDEIRQGFVDADTKVKEDIIGESGDASTVDTIYGAKKYAEEKAAAAKEEVQGTEDDTKDSATVAGAKKYAEEQATAAKEAVQGTEDDTKDSATVVGAKKYADEKVKAVNDVLTGHTGNTTIHITAEERDQWNQTKTDIDNFFASDAKVEGTIDTLKEIQEWLNNADNKDASDIIQAISDEATTRKEFDDNFNERILELESKFTGDNSVQNQINGLEEEITNITKEGGELDQHQAAAEANVIGESGDASTENTIYGAKKYAKEEATTAKSEAISEVQGDSDTDTKESATIVGAKKYAEEKATTAKSEAISEVQGDSDTDTKNSATIAGAKKYADFLDEEMDKRVDALEDATHTHSNKELLDTYTQTEVNLADAVAKKHEHGNKTVLDGITAENVTAWSAAEANAKAYVDNLDGGATSEEGTYVTVQVTSAGGKVTDVIVTEDYSNLVIDCGTYDA